MKPRPPYVKAEDVPAPSRREFEDFVRQLVSVPKAELDRREAKYKRRRKTTKRTKATH
jgi:hypothetical protein